MASLSNLIGMSEFKFKRFTVVNDRSAMKVNTDGVLLGASMTIAPTSRCMLDVGTGTGTIALMAAQRMADSVTCPTLKIDAIDIDEASAAEAAQNFDNSPWAELMSASHASLKEYDASLDPEVRYDHIFSNPPYFEDSLQAPDQRRNDSRHTSTGLSYRELMEFAKVRLSSDGHISIVLPSDAENGLTRYARMCGLHLFRIMRIRTVPRKVPSRIVAEFSFRRCDNPSEELLTIQNEGRYTQEYLALTRDFYLFA